MSALTLIPRMLALMAVQRQRAASRSTSPCRRGQHWSFPTGRLSFSRFSTLAHTFSLSASIGHEPLPEGGVGTAGGLGDTGGAGVGQFGSQLCTTNATKERTVRNTASLDGVIATIFLLASFFVVLVGR
ncbi:hypothetical protein HU200_008968 [Digitaria exilis]|uniref:Uncharacterized protein n=1 Tax=Digitaria exilis TaxID=1010633 RepID=A0A835B2V1_9POAL|nr:hypothetical protein HU200_042196 [Digitaria exilis]KAF8688777.1 hypothetical protein HU200_042173 [Digitaria exilis]KAF8688837.1 hypothetical protein HU200_042169 [Digitaria exilis]KAF8762880.1 hypothetical protein HU200_008962 [Digitaria exilis]KAF8762886.1 hypothetical protein HU200_008968 [Digitaria exilis]